MWSYHSLLRKHLWVITLIQHLQGLLEPVFRGISQIFFIFVIWTNGGSLNSLYHFYASVHVTASNWNASCPTFPCLAEVATSEQFSSSSLNTPYSPGHQLLCILKPPKPLKSLPLPIVCFKTQSPHLRPTAQQCSGGLMSDTSSEKAITMAICCHCPPNHCPGMGSKFWAVWVLGSGHTGDPHLSNSKVRPPGLCYNLYYQYVHAKLRLWFANAGCSPLMSNEIVWWITGIFLFWIRK